MKQKKGFTLIELLVVISIIALLLALLMPALGKARNLAMIASCSGQLKQWGTVCAQYANDNKDMFWQGWFGDPQPPTGNAPVKMWMCVMWKYYQNPAFTYCPAAKLPLDASNSGSGNSDRAWGGTTGLTWCKMPRPGVKDNTGAKAYWSPKGSYGENSWVANKTGGNYTRDNRYWRSRNIRNGNNVPMLGDSAWIDAWVDQNSEPPEYKDLAAITSGDNVWRVCIDRHKGKNVWVFVDSSVRAVGIKELFALNWSKDYEPKKNRFTWNYYGGSGNPANLWPAWMKGFKEYMDK